MNLIVVIFCLCIVSKSIFSDIIENIKFNKGLLFPKTTTIGYLVGATIPIDLKDESAYVFFGFEQYYPLPYKQYNWFPDDEERSFSSNAALNRTRKSPQSNYEKIASLLTRKRVYRLLRKKLELYGMNGKACLLRTICEVNENPLAEHNGVYGDIVQMLFSPSTSEDEGIGDEYYEAEYNGYMEDCSPYIEDCPSSLLDLFTTEYDVLCFNKSLDND